MSEYKELQGMYGELRKRCEEFEKKNTELLDFKKAVTSKPMNFKLRVLPRRRARRAGRVRGACRRCHRPIPALRGL